MADLGQHLRIRLFDDRVVAPSVNEQRIVARAVAGIARDLPVLAFGLADTHFHGETLGDERLANEIARRIGCSLRRRLRLPVGFHVMPPRPIRDVWHLARCFGYVNTQPVRHGVAKERWFEATSLPDLLGLRPRGAFLIERMREHLPRLRREDLLAWIGVPDIRPAVGTPTEVWEGALAASARSSIQGRSLEAISLRRAALALIDPGPGRGELAELLGISERSVTRLRSLRPDPALVNAISLNVGLQQALVQRAAGESSGSGSAAAGR